MDLTGQRDLLFRAPYAEGYRDQDDLQPRDAISPLSFAALFFSVTEILGQQQTSSITFTTPFRFRYF